MKHRLVAARLGATLLALAAPVFAAPSAKNALPNAALPNTALPALSAQLPAWLGTERNNDIFYKRGPYNFAIYDIPALARDMNGVAVGHSLAYEALVTGREKSLETSIFGQIDRVLKNPPALMPAERFLSPTFGKRYGALEQTFSWTHVAHAQTIDALVSPRLGNAEKDRETHVLWDYYQQKGAPFIVTSLPMNMAWLDSQPYSGAFRRKYPRVNALFWGYHWLQTSVYDGLRGKTPAEQRRVYTMLGARYHGVELYDTKRPFMPMMGETSPLFAAQFPDIANGFDNLHMLHDMVNDILASEGMTPIQKRQQINRALFILSPDAHRGCKPGENRGVEGGISHDHRFMAGMPGMGLMKNGTETSATVMATPSIARNTSLSHNDLSLSDNKPPLRDNKLALSDKKPPLSDNEGPLSHNRQTLSDKSSLLRDNRQPLSDNEKADGGKVGAFDPTALMWMPQMGWMNMSECHHCSMPLEDNGIGDAAWQASTVSAEGWTMRVRCALCARDMSAEVKGGAILSLATEDPQRRVIVFSDEQGNLSTEFRGAVFLEEKAGHVRCSQWSQAFTSQLAFEAYVAVHPRFKGAKALSFQEWASVEPAGTPATYSKESGPVENPYAADLQSRGGLPGMKMGATP